MRQTRSPEELGCERKIVEPRDEHFTHRHEPASDRDSSEQTPGNVSRKHTLGLRVRKLTVEQLDSILGETVLDPVPQERRWRGNR
jgi:hypothetical protein